MEILNIDAFVQPKRVLTMGGVQHEVKPLTVQDFIDNLKAASELEGKSLSEVPLHEQVDASVKEIIKAVPTLQEGVVRAMSIEAITAILNFIRGDLDPKAGAKATEGEGADSAKKPA